MDALRKTQEITIFSIFNDFNLIVKVPKKTKKFLTNGSTIFIKFRSNVLSKGANETYLFLIPEKKKAR